MNQYKVNVGRALSEVEKEELSELFGDVSEREFNAFQSIALEELQEVGEIEPIFDRVSSDPIKEETYYEDSDVQKIIEFAVMKIIHEAGILRSKIKENSSSFYMTNYAGRSFLS